LITLRFGATVGFFLTCWFFASPFLDALFSLMVLRIFFLFLRDVAILPKTSLFFSTLICPLILFSLYYFPKIEPMPYLAVTLVNLMVAFVFSNNLLRGRSTILLQFVKTAHLGPEPSKDFANYLKQQCVIWGIISLLSAAVAGVALVSEASRPLAGKGLIALFLIQALWFVLSHEIARRRFGRPETWFGTLHLITQRSSWKKLEI
jgi:uncharacterized membrane protein